VIPPPHALWSPLHGWLVVCHLLKCHLHPDQLASCILAPRGVLPLTHVCFCFHLCYPLSPPLSHPRPLVVPALLHREPQVVLVALLLNRLRSGFLSSPSGWIIWSVVLPFPIHPFSSATTQSSQLPLSGTQSPWILDSRASSHMTHDSTHLGSLSLLPSRASVKTADGTPLPVVSHGTLHTP
jgi:hypothetical protein